MIEGAGTPITGSLVTTLTPMLRRMAQRRVRQEDIEDVVQETWISALRSVSRYEGRAKISVWIVGILKRRIADNYRRERLAQILRDDTAPCEGTLALERTQYAQMVRQIEAAFTDLTELERTAVRLCDLQELGRTEAARALRIRPGYLRVVLHRAHNKLAISLTKQGHACSQLRKSA